jgi:methylenetetrahydrofolate reductase (NADPH)
MSKFEEILGQKDFVVTAEVDPPKGTDLEAFKETAAKLSGKVDALIVSDNRNAEARMSPLAAAAAVGGNGLEVILTLTCRDRNRLALTSDLLAAASWGLQNLLLVTGDFVSLGDHPDAKPVFDLDSVQTLQLAAALAQGHDLAGGELLGAKPFFAGATVAPGSSPLGPQLMKLRKKVAAGAGFIVTRPVPALAQLRDFVGQAGTLDPAAAGSLFKEIKSSGLVAGAHLSAADGHESLLELVAACGL